MLGHRPYAFTLSRTHGCCVVHAAGELDIAAVPEMRETVDAASRDVERLIIDLRDVSFLDSFALQALIALQRDWSHRRSFHVVPGDGIQRVLDLAGARAALRWISPEQLEG